MSATVSIRCSLGDLFVVQGFLRLRDRGPWVAFLECSSKENPTGPATLVVRREDGTEDTFVGTVRRSDVHPGSETLTVSLVGGAGKLIDKLEVRDHVAGVTPVTAGLVASAIVSEAGEVLAAGVEDALDARTLTRWHRAQDTTAAVALDLLCAELGLVWRVLQDGTIWIGEETWPVSTASAFWMDQDPEDGRVIYAPDGAPLLVGQQVGELRAIEVIYTFGEGLRASVRGAVAGDPPHVPDLDLYRASYSGSVRRFDADDGTIDVACDDARIGELRAVPLRVAWPGVTIATIPQDTRVRVRFDGASPSGAYASEIDQEMAEKPFALQGDSVSCSWIFFNVGLQAIQVVAPGTPGAVQVVGTIGGPGHKYARGVPGVS